MFNRESNRPFNNSLFTIRTIGAMHPSMVRLYRAAFEAKKIKGQSALARAMTESPQTVKNWESRGLSKRAAMKAQELFGCDANDLLAGDSPSLHPAAHVEHRAPRSASPPIASEDAEAYGWPFLRVSQSQYGSLTSEEKQHVENGILVLIRAKGDTSHQEQPADYGASR